MVVVLFVDVTVSVARVQGVPFVAGGQISVQVGQRVVQDSPGGDEGDGSHGSYARR